MKIPFPFLLSSLAVLIAPNVHSAPKGATLDDLKKLDITCLVPGWLPEGYKFKSATIDYSDREGLKDKKAPAFPAYTIEYSNGKKGRFTIESARWGIGDRNLDENDKAEESQFEAKGLGPVYIIYYPPGKSGVKQRINANWIEDATLKAEKAKNGEALPVKGRYHGVSGFGMTIAEYEKIVQSLHPAQGK